MLPAHLMLAASMMLIGANVPVAKLPAEAFTKVHGAGLLLMLGSILLATWPVRSRHGACAGKSPASRSRGQS